MCRHRPQVRRLAFLFPSPVPLLLPPPFPRRAWHLPSPLPGVSGLRGAGIVFILPLGRYLLGGAAVASRSRPLREHARSPMAAPATRGAAGWGEGAAGSAECRAERVSAWRRPGLWAAGLHLPPRGRREGRRLRGGRVCLPPVRLRPKPLRLCTACRCPHGADPQRESPLTAAVHLPVLFLGDKRPGKRISPWSRFFPD